MKSFFVFVIICMLGLTVWASLDSNVIDGFRFLFQNPWGVATLGDTYFGFMMIYLWIAYKETSLVKKILWFVLVMSLGTIAISIYGLIELVSLEKGASFERFLIKRNV